MNELGKYERIVESVRDGVYTVNSEGYVTMVNESMASILGYKREELIGKHLLEVVDEDSMEDAETVVRDTLSKGERDTDIIEVELPTKDGDCVPCEVQISVFYSGDEYAGAAGTVREVEKKKKLERELENYKAIVETARDGLYIVDEDGYFIEANESLASMTGFSRDQLIGSHASLILSEETLEKGEELIRRLLSESEVESDSYEMEVRTKSGETLITENHISLLPFDEEYRGSVGVVRDITERKEMEEELRESEQRLSLLVEQSRLGVIEWNLDFEIEEWNPAAERIFGYKKNEVIGKHASFIIPDDEMGGVEESWKELIEGEGGEHNVNRNVTKDGEEIVCEWNSTTLIDEEGEVVGVASMVRDITERTDRIETLDALHEATRDLMKAETSDEVCGITVNAAQEILGLTVSLIHLYDDETGLLEPVAYTEAVEEMVDRIQKYRPGEGVTGEVFEEGEPFVDQDVEETDSDYVRDPEYVPMKSVMINPLGEHGVLTVGSIKPGVFDESKIDFAKILASNTESALDRAQRESLLREREEELERQNHRLENFAGLVTHDLRNPLQIAEGFLEMAQETGDEQYFERIDDALSRMDRIIEDVLTLAKQGESVGETELIDLERLVYDAWDNVDTKEAELEIVDTLEILDADRSRLMEAVENLFRNSIEHGGDDVTVRVGHVKDSKDSKDFYIEDDGPGILPAERDAVFESGYTTEEDGTGFGLAIVKEIIEAHGWSIDVGNGRDGGARFVITGID